MQKGFLIPCPQKYEHICLENVRQIRKFGCQSIIEIWEVGQEISDNIRSAFKAIANIRFQNVNDYTDKSSYWKGFQIKAFALYYTKLQECILCDADVFFYENPEQIWYDPHYLETGTYFFRDLERWRFQNLSSSISEHQNKFSSLAFYKKRKAFILSLLPQKGPLFPIEWEYLYEEAIPENVQEALQESGVVYMNKSKQQNSIEQIFTLNQNYPTTYQYVWGDKETFWIGCVMAGNPFYFNPHPAIIYQEKLTHTYQKKLFWKQK